MVKDLKNKIVVITGGAEGIGYEIANSYLKQQAKTAILLDINEKQGVDAEKKLSTKYGTGRAVFIKCDVTKDLEAVSAKIFDSFKQVDILINNAGIYNNKEIKKMIDINVTAVIEWSRKFWEHMRKDKKGNGGTIINVASIYGYRIDQFVPAYQASKFAVMGFTKSLGHEYNYKKTGVRVLAICPGLTETKLASEAGDGWDDLAVSDSKDFLEGYPWQKAEAVGKAAVDIFERGDSGTAWLIEGSQPIAEVVLSTLCR